MDMETFFTPILLYFFSASGAGASADLLSNWSRVYAGFTFLGGVFF
jgi:hypothetical protein